MNNYLRILRILVVLTTFVYCFGCTHSYEKISFPDDSIFRYLVFESHKISHQAENLIGFTSLVYLYNIDFNQENVINDLSSFARYYYCHKNKTDSIIYSKSYISILSDPFTFDRAPYYYDDVNINEALSKVIYKIVIDYEPLSNTFKVHLRIDGENIAVPLPDSIRSCNDLTENTIVFEELKERRWGNILKKSKEAWKLYKTNH